MKRTWMLIGMALASAWPLGRALATDANVPMQINEAGPAAGAAAADAARVSIELVRSDLGDALRLLAKQGDINLVIGPDVKAEVSVSLKDVPVRQALQSLVLGNGFRWAESNGIITVFKPLPEDAAAAERPPELITRIFRPRSVNATTLVDALKPALSKWGKLTVLSEDSKAGYGLGTSSLSSGGPTAVGGGGGGGGGFGGPARASGVPAPVINQAFGGGGVQAVSNGPGGMMVENSSVLLVTDTARHVQVVAKLIEELDVAPRQVLIETRIVEMSVDLQKRLGIDWNIEAFANGPTLSHEVPLFWRADFGVGPNRVRDGNGINLALGSVDFQRFQALLQAQQTDTAVRLLANPRMLVYNNHRSSILVGEQYPLLTSTITDQGTTTESLGGYIPVGIQLSVTPTILADNRVSLLVHPSTSALGDDVVGTTGLRIARIQTREIDTRVVIRDGDTIVLGGLISDRKTNIARKVPGLGDVPILDIFTRQERPRQERVDLLVFLSVYVDGGARLNDGEKRAYEKYKPRFSHADSVGEVPLHFDFPGTQFHEPKGGPVPPPGDDPMEPSAPAAPATSAVPGNAGAEAQPANAAGNASQLEEVQP